MGIRSMSTAVLGLTVALAASGCVDPPIAPDTEATDATEGTFLLASDTTLEEARTGNPMAIRVEPCDPESTECLPCDSPNTDGLRVEPRVGRVRCGAAHSGHCFDERAKVVWSFAGLDATKKYRAVVSYDAGKASGTETADAYCAAGECEDTGPGDKLKVRSKRPKLRGIDNATVTYWSYRIDLFEIVDGNETLIACADPEIIVDPPGGFMPPEESPVDPEEDHAPP